MIIQYDAIQSCLFRIPLRNGISKLLCLHIFNEVALLIRKPELSFNILSEILLYEKYLK